jgi:hypothetical protein
MVAGALQLVLVPGFNLPVINECQNLFQKPHLFSTGIFRLFRILQETKHKKYPSQLQVI